MASLDTNVLARWLMADDVAQTAQVAALLESALAANATLFVPTTVQLELEWVLRSRYALDKPTVLTTFTALLETQELELQFEAALERALHLYRQGTADFADCLHAGLSEAAAQAPLLTFDAKAARLDGVHLIRR
jgi:predicted nucleic-acid-binding protein